MAASNMIVQNNIAALNTHRSMKGIGRQQMKASERLSSGFRINRAADDAAGLAISEKMRGQIRGLAMASKNVDDSISLIKTAEGGMQGIDDMLHRIRELVVYVANDTHENNAEKTGDRQKVQDEIDQLVMEIDDMSERVEFNKKKLINGSFQDTKQQVGNAKEIFDRRGLEQIMTSAKVSSLQCALGTPTSPASNAASADAYARLNSAQGVLDANDNTVAGSTLRFMAATETFAVAQSSYDVLVNSYNDSMAQLRTLLGSKTLTDLTAQNFTTSHPQILQNAADVAAAMYRYSAAAEALGIDEMRMREWSTSTAGSAVATQVDTFTSNTANTLRDAISTDVGAVNSWSVAVHPDTMVANRGIATYHDASAVFAGEEVIYKNSVARRDTIQAEVSHLENELMFAKRENYNATVRLTAADISYRAALTLDNHNISEALHFQVGSNGGQSLLVSIGSLKSDTLGIGDGMGRSYINVVKNTGVDITATIDVLDQAKSYVTTERSKLGAVQNRMEHTQSSLDITHENLSDAESRIRDADMAKEMMNFTKANILQQVSVAMMAQANQLPQSVLQLIR